MVVCRARHETVMVMVQLTLEARRTRYAILDVFENSYSGSTGSTKM